MILQTILIATMALPAAPGSTSINLAAPDTPRLEYREPGTVRYDQPRFLDLLGRGWRTPYSGDLIEHSDALWAGSINAELELFVLEPRDLILHLILRPHAVERYEPQRVDLVFNGTRLGTCAFTKEEGWAFKKFAVAVPAAVMRSGQNTLTFLSHYCVSAADVGRGGDAADGRAVAFGIQGLALLPPEAGDPDFAAPAPAVTLAGDTMTLSPGTRVVVPVDPQDKEAITLHAATAAGPVRVEQDAFPGLRSATIEVSPEGAALELGGDAPFRLVFDHPGGNEAAVWKAPALHFQSVAGLGGTVRKAVEKPAVKRVVVIVHDTLRADATGFGGAYRDVTPFMDALAAKGMVYTRAYTHSSWTYPSIVSALTGLHPVQHGVNHQGDALSTAVPALAAQLQAAGIATGCIAENPYFSPRNGLARGFDTYEYVYPTQATGGSRGSEVVLVKAREFVERHAADRFFLYLQFFPPHAPYAVGNPHDQTMSKDVHQQIPPDDVAMHDAEIGNAPMSDEGIQQLRARYDENVRYADDMTREVFAMLEANGLGADTAILITSDHGESFGEHGNLGHSDAPYESQVHVPFVYVLGTEGTGPAGIAESFVHTVDLAPTVADLLDAPLAADLPGHSLFGPDDLVYTGVINRMQAECQHPQVAYRTPRYKLIVDPAGGLRALYDLEVDPGETANILPFRPVLADYIEAQGLAWERAQREAMHFESGDAATISEEERTQLETLGYF